MFRELTFRWEIYVLNDGSFQKFSKMEMVFAEFNGREDFNGQYK